MPQELGRLVLQACATMPGNHFLLFRPKSRLFRVAYENPLHESVLSCFDPFISLFSEYLLSLEEFPERGNLNSAQMGILGTRDGKRNSSYTSQRYRWIYLGKQEYIQGRMWAFSRESQLPMGLRTVARGWTRGLNSGGVKQFCTSFSSPCALTLVLLFFK